jgi:lipoate-protein ligase A
MLPVEVLVQRDLGLAASHCADMALLDRAAQLPGRGSLRVYSIAGDALSLGRYHLAPSGDVEHRIGLHRRLGGGRAATLGPGFVTVALTLPHRSALVASDPLALRPEQALNRFVRGLLAGLRGLGVDAFYPGRDRVTVNRRLLGLVSLEGDARGVAVFEAVLAIDGDWSRVSDVVAAVDREGVVAAEELAAAEVTTLAASGASPPLEELAHRVAGAFAEQFGVELTSMPPPAVPPDAAERTAAWIASRRRRPELTCHAVTWTQLGIVEAYLATRGDTITDVVLAGDFIADSESISNLEQRLSGCVLDRAAVAAIVDAVFARSGRFLLGVGRMEVVDTIMSAAGRR